MRPGYKSVGAVNVMKLPNIFKRKSKSKPVHRLTAKDLDFAFKDTAGRSYFRINTQLGIGLAHYGKAMEFTMWMSAGLTEAELHKLIDVAEAAMERLVAGKKGSLATVGWALNEMKLRSQMVIHTELLYQFIACHYIREDEPLSEWVESIHNEKVEAFKECVKERTAYDFFLLPELQNLTAMSTMSPDEWNSYWQDSIREQKRLQRQIDYLRSELKSGAGQRTSTGAL